jgi:hypothetical protein
VTLTLHSGIYALRRVYRPLPAMVAAELAGLLLVPALWPWLARWSFPVAMLASTVIATAVVLHYTTRLYGLLGWLPVRLARPAVSRGVAARDLREFFFAGASYALMKLDALLMLAMFRSRPDATSGIGLFVVRERRSRDLGRLRLGPASVLRPEEAGRALPDGAAAPLRAVGPPRQLGGRRRTVGLACLLGTVICAGASALTCSSLPSSSPGRSLAVVHIQAFRGAVPHAPGERGRARRPDRDRSDRPPYRGAPSGSCRELLRGLLARGDPGARRAGRRTDREVRPSQTGSRA